MKTNTWLGISSVIAVGVLGVQVHSQSRSTDGAQQETSRSIREKQDENTRAAQKISPLLMFYGTAEEAMTFYVSLFRHSSIKSIERWGPGEPGAEGSVKHAVFVLDGQEFICIDSSVKHDFTFTPATSLHVKCESEAEIDELFAKLAKDGKVFMPLQRYPFARKFAWLSDRLGLSWQLSLPSE